MKIDYSRFKDKIKFWKKIIEVEEFFGSSPPAVFVGRHGYPKVNFGILSLPEISEQAIIYDYPEEWYKQKASFYDILSYRAKLIYSRSKTHVKKSERFLDKVQEIVPAKKNVDVEIKLKKKPRLRLWFSYYPPIANSAPIEKISISSNPKIERKVQHVIYDTDWNAREAVYFLYKKGIDISRIQKMFSAGLIGSTINRKLVPTRWSITAVDNIIAEKLLEQVKQFDKIEHYEVFFNEYLGNRFFIVFIPNYYEYELIEFWDLDKSISIAHDYEPYKGRKEYAYQTTGAFYAAKLACLEYLVKIKKQASILIIREITPDYIAPVGVWKIRETVRDAFSKKPLVFEDWYLVMKYLSSKLITRSYFVKISTMIKNMKKQSSLKNFTTQG